MDSIQPQAPAALTAKKEPPIQSEKDAGWAYLPVWKLRRKLFCP